jgi:predicted GIY-YIG superfamily endonuclease
MIGGIDQQIQQRVDAYRDNPQQLMQRYQQNQELIDLLAMQKLKSEKDAAAREIQMQMHTPQLLNNSAKLSC